MAMPILVHAWKEQVIREQLVHLLDRQDLATCRLICRDLALELAPLLFTEITIFFRSGILTKPSHLAVLQRIGPFIQSMTFKMPHTAETFLPPVIDPMSGKEQTFMYTPQCHQTRPKNPRYGSWEMTDLLVKQYPPLFHAAADIPSFVQAFSSMPNLCHLRINCDGQLPSHRYRRSIVDYALISLRIAVEQAPLLSLNRLSLLSVHPGAVLYLRPSLSFGASPASRKRWSQIRHLSIRMASFPHETGPTDHLKLLHAYLHSFPALHSLVFHWEGQKGLSPISLASEPCLTRPINRALGQYGTQKTKASLRPLKMPSLQHMELVNATIDASQVASFIFDHRHSLHEFNLQDVHLRTGSWDEALAPLTKLSGNERWKETQKHASAIDVPIVLSPAGVSQKQLQRAICAVQRQKDGLRSLAQTRVRERIWGRPDHMKRLVPPSVLSWR
ncbi:hypothetical protein N7532_012015 [Penicillium argentinense]|uniref:Uncharacterized protein n=1 Tax=Penicillium argentinense TaxID=1131581 RepID=A0A9W9EJK2_9EURO|nr:uncharacterized protein N7532_012015 [Penicillium argentinense]KAJ5082972.1 hypothetical protein N7532_012015 [Penicillium argentinense]